MNKDKEPTVRSQSDLYGRISRAYENLRKSGTANITIGLAEARLQALEANWAKFEFQHDKLLEHWEALSESTYVKTDMPTLAEEAYLTQKGMFLDTLRRLRAAEMTETTAFQSAPSHPARTTLPRIQLPQFSGLYEDWPSFRDLFHSLIGKDTSAAPVEKLHYLKACLKGEAELLIRSLPTTDENFERAWKSLTDYYENKRLLVRSYLARFTAIQRLRGESSADLRNLYHGVLSTVGSLESIGRPIARGEDLFVHLVVDLLDSRSRREWESAIGDTTEPPMYASLIQFLDRRLHTLESLPPSRTESSYAKPETSSGRPTRVLHPRRPDGQGGRCTMCNQEHHIMHCDAFKAKTALERRKHIGVNQLCFNCLRRHWVSDCPSEKTCSSCGERHHTLLHDAGNTHEVARASLSAARSAKAAPEVLLATARVRVADKFGVQHTVRALVDQGSEVSLVAESLAQRLELTRAPTSTSIVGVGGRSTAARGQVELALTPLRDGPPLQASAFVLDRLTPHNGGLRADRHSWRHVDDLELADPDFFAADPVELLLGADGCAGILQPGLRRGGPQQPVAQRTTLGWILSGTVGVTAAGRSAHTYPASRSPRTSQGRRASQARTTGLHQEASGDRAERIAHHASQRRGLAPANLPRRRATHPRVQQTATLESPRAATSQGRAQAVRHPCAMAGGHAAADHGGPAMSSRRSSRTIPARRHGPRRPHPTTHDDRARTSLARHRASRIAGRRSSSAPSSFAQGGGPPTPRRESGGSVSSRVTTRHQPDGLSPGSTACIRETTGEPAWSPSAPRQS
ncbi:hypothetical protein ACS0PU_005334 [Formica fusca]